MTIFIDPDLDAAATREIVYRGKLLILTRIPAVTELVRHTWDELTRLFAPHDPELAHEHLHPEEMARLLGTWKPQFIHSDRSKQLVRRIIDEAGFPAAGTHYDLPRPRTSFPVGHLTTGIAYAFPWHRDTWYAAPAQQVNWWLPVSQATEDNAMAFDLGSFDRPVPNTSAGFDYYRNNVHRLSTASQVTRERQPRPAAPTHEPVHEEIVLPAQGHILLFSGTHLHRSIPNTSRRARYSVDFRTVDVGDIVGCRGAPVLDVRCTGTAIRDFHNVADGSAFEEELVARLFGEPPPGATLVFGEQPH